MSGGASVRLHKQPVENIRAKAARLADCAQQTPIPERLDDRVSSSGDIMQLRRRGFTLIELLIVIVIIGILAAIAIPRYSKTREKAFFRAMISDLRGIHNLQEIYYTTPGNNFTYANHVSLLPDAVLSDGVHVLIVAASHLGWSATASHGSLLPTQQCGVWVGTVERPAFVHNADAVVCTNE